jgi:hypothetical protein
MDNIKPYTTKSGAQQFKPSVALLQELDDDNMGFCLACGEAAEGVEPDARRYTCERCGASKVYGAAELALMGLFF